MGAKQDHHLAVLTLLRAAPPSGDPLTVYDGYVPAAAVGPYVLVRITTTTPEGSSFTNEQDIAVTRIYCHCVAGGLTIGGDAIAVAAVADRVEQALLNVTPTIAGRNPWPIRDDGDTPPANDDSSTGVTIFTQRVTYRFQSLPEPAP